jgi:hypothetical protein
MVHLSNGEAWKYFNRVHSQFLMESRNVHLVLFIYEFNSFESFDAFYSCWTVILIVSIYYWKCVWGWSSYFYLWSYLVQMSGSKYRCLFDCWLINWNSYGHPWIWFIMSQENRFFRWRQLWCGLSMIFLLIKWFLVGACMKN